MACRACGFVFRVPPVPVSTVPHPDAMPSSGGQWFLRFAGGRQFGPVLTHVIEEWVHEKRADGECLVCPENGSDWYRVADAFPDLMPPEATTAPVSDDAPLTSPAEYLPAAGLLEFLPEGRTHLSSAARALHYEAADMLDKELRRGMGAVKKTGTRSVFFEDEDSEDPRSENTLRPGHALVVELTAHGSTFYLIIPWGRMGRMPHEFFSILPGKLPHPLALRRGGEEEFGEGQWIGINGAEDDSMATSARRSQEILADGIEWNWFSRRRDFTMVLVWGVQAVPLGAEKFLHAMQTNPRGQTSSDFGVLWYLERQSAFYRFARRLSIPDTHESHILFASVAGRLLVVAAEQIAVGTPGLSSENAG